MRVTINETFVQLFYSIAAFGYYSLLLVIRSQIITDMNVNIQFRCYVKKHLPVDQWCGGKLVAMGEGSISYMYFKRR